MSKYKPGDKVKVREDLITHKKYGIRTAVSDMTDLRGKIVTINKVIGCNLYAIKEDKWPYYEWTEEMLEPAPFGKHLLRDGVIVKRRDDTYAIVIGDNTHSGKGYIFLDEYNDDLSNRFDPSNYDIMAIYTPDGRGSIYDLLKGEFLELIAERPTEVKEMTLEEICKELGYDVKIVKED